MTCSIAAIFLASKVAFSDNCSCLSSDCSGLGLSIVPLDLVCVAGCGLSGEQYLTTAPTPSPNATSNAKRVLIFGEDATTFFSTDGLFICKKFINSTFKMIQQRMSMYQPHVGRSKKEKLC